MQKRTAGAAAEEDQVTEGPEGGSAQEGQQHLEDRDALLEVGRKGREAQLSSLGRQEKAVAARQETRELRQQALKAQRQGRRAAQHPQFCRTEHVQG